MQPYGGFEVINLKPPLSFEKRKTDELIKMKKCRRIDNKGRCSDGQGHPPSGWLLLRGNKFCSKNNKRKWRNDMFKRKRFSAFLKKFDQYPFCVKIGQKEYKSKAIITLAMTLPLMRWY